MSSNRILLTLVMLSVLVVAGLAVLGWSLEPGRTARWARVALVLPVLWGFSEFLQFRGESPRKGQAIMNWHRRVIASVGLLMTVDLSFELAISAELLETYWEPIARRITAVMFGTGMVVWGNYLPKQLSPWNAGDEPFDWQRVHRFAGWMVSLGGIAVMIVWLVLPVSEARLATLGIIATSFGLVLVRKFMSFVARLRRQPPVVP